METATIQNSLRYLLKMYLANPDALCQLGMCEELPECANTRQLHELGAYLVKKGYVKDQRFEVKDFSCRITLLGINTVSNLMRELQFTVLQASIEEKKRSLVEILGFTPGHFRKVVDCAHHLKKAGLVECIFHNQDVLASPTFFGREWYNANKMHVMA